MTSVADVLAALERLAPARFAYPDDRIGLQVGDPGAPVQKIVTSLDRSLGAVRFCRDRRAQMLIAHHPLIWEPLRSVREDDHVGLTVSELISAGIAFAAAHTNWDAAPGGVNDVLCEMLGIQNAVPFGTASRVERLHLVTYVPEKNLQSLIDALSRAGAGMIGLYRRCAYYSQGTGTYLPLEGAAPTVGAVGRIEETPEVRLEMILPESNADDVSTALRDAHPYDEPAFHFHKLWSAGEMPIGRLGSLDQPRTLGWLAENVDLLLSTKCAAWGSPNADVEHVAVVGGAGGDLWRAAKNAGARVLVTGEVAHHQAVEATEVGFCLIQAGHYATENPGARRLGERLSALLPGVEFEHFEPAIGDAGRPL